MDVLSRPVLVADHRIHYGPDASQFGDLWIPELKGSPEFKGLPKPNGVPEPRPHALAPVVVFFHGGWWQSAYDLGYAGYLCAALRHEGIACWSVEYRRVGATGGGWPTTFQDAAAGFDFVGTLAKLYALDRSRVVVMGHSAGGHLAFWMAGRHHIEPHSEVYLPRPQVALRGAIALAGVVDLRLTIDLAGYFTFAHDKAEVYAFMGGTPQQVPQRYQAGNPGDLLPFQVEQVLLQGDQDEQIPPQLPTRWAELSRSRGSGAEVRMLAGVDHFDLVDPESKAWGTVLSQVKRLLYG